MSRPSAEIRALGTERRNHASRHLDSLSALRIARTINREDRNVAQAVGRALPQVARAIDLIAKAVGDGGRLIYVGAGSSGRIAALDASECPPTFGVSPGTVRFLIAGGERALSHASEVSEDARPAARKDMAGLRLSREDVVVGLAASGRTPYTLAALQFARRRGAKTIAVVGTRNSPLARTAELAIEVEVGAEVVAGSSRMKAGTAQKMVLNMLSTGAMAHLGYIYGNQMVNVQTRSLKLVERGLGILQDLAGVDRVRAQRALRECGGSVPVALISLKAGTSPSQARARLRQARGHVRRALELALKARGAAQSDGKRIARTMVKSKRKRTGKRP